MLLIKKVGLDLFQVEIEFMQNKILKEEDYRLFNNILVHGFLKCITRGFGSHPLFFDSENIKGSMVHRGFHDDNFRSWWLTYNLDKEA
ncbi:MAG: hypothetical protein MZU97_01600 [Bacillus subtilis]|nr:hypothetical protein [Bacillus subtilis]